MKKIIYALSVGVVLGALVVWYAFPRYKTEVQTKIITEYKTKVVERIVTKPDGTTTIDRTTETSGSQVATQSTKESVSNWSASIAVESSFSRLEPVYEAGLSRRIVGPVFAGVYANTNKEAGVSLSVEF